MKFNRRSFVSISALISFSKSVVGKTNSDRYVDCHSPSSHGQPLEEGDPTLAREHPINVSALSQSFVSSVDTVDALRRTSRRKGDVVIVRGYHEEGDGGGGEFYWDESCSDSDDLGITISTDVNSTPGRWRRILKGTAMPIQWGVKTAVDLCQLTRLNAMFQAAEEYDLKIIAPDEYIFLKTAGYQTAIELKKVPTIENVLRIKWGIIAAGSNRNRLFEINGIKGLKSIYTLRNSPKLASHTRCVSLSRELDISSGDWIAIEAGEDPSDKQERHWSAVCRVEKYNSSTGLLMFSEPVPYNINYGKNFSDLVIYKLLHNPVGGRLNISVDYSSLGRNRPTHSVITRFCRGFTIPIWEEFEPDFGLALGPGTEDVNIGTFSATQTETQGKNRDPRQMYGPWASRNVTVQNMRLTTQIENKTSLGVQLEAHALDHKIESFRIDINLPTPPDLPIFKTAGGSRLRVDTVTVNSNQRCKLHSHRNVTGEEYFTCNNLIINGEGVIFDPESVLGSVVKTGGECEFGPLQIVDFLLDPSGAGGYYSRPLHNIVIAKVWTWMESANAAPTITIRCVDNISIAEKIDCSNKGQWIETQLSDNDIYWGEPDNKKIHRINNIALSKKEVIVSNSTSETLHLRVLCRLVSFA